MVTIGGFQTDLMWIILKVANKDRQTVDTLVEFDRVIFVVLARQQPSSDQPPASTLLYTPTSIMPSNHLDNPADTA